jgi:23S rRNA pseudouridine2605 synthase
VTVGGTVAKLGERAAVGDSIELDGQPLELRGGERPARVIAYHKPEGELVTRSDPQGRPTVFARLPKLRDGRWIAVGRLDLNSSGLLLFTDSGELANRLMHPRHEVEREYAVRVLGELTREAEQRLLSGVPLEDGEARFSQLEPMERGRERSANRWYRVTLGEGRKREVRRLFEAVGCKVSRLIRIRYGAMRLPRSLKPGRWLELAPDEVARLSAGGDGKSVVRVGKSC